MAWIFKFHFFRLYQLLEFKKKNILPHCSLKQSLLIFCVTFTLMQRGILVIYPSFAQIRPDFECDADREVCGDLQERD